MEMLTLDEAIEALRNAARQMPSAELQSREYIEQIRWERDTAVQQLNELGYGLGEKVRTDGDTISRQSAIDLAKDLMIPGMDYLQHNQAIMNYEAELVRLPSAEPEIIRCQYCKHNTSKPNAGNASCELFYGMSDQFGFCHRAERRTDEEADIS